MLVAAALIGCGDNVTEPPIDAPEIVVDLYGEPCTIFDPAAVNSCRNGAGVCRIEASGPVCRPWCCYHPGTNCVVGEDSCPSRGGMCQLQEQTATSAGGFYFCGPTDN
jgi:hypothetical protein